MFVGLTDGTFGEFVEGEDEGVFLFTPLEDISLLKSIRVCPPNKANSSSP